MPIHAGSFTRTSRLYLWGVCTSADAFDPVEHERRVAEWRSFPLGK